MKWIYEEPEMKIREYTIPANGLITTSPPDPDLGDGDDYGDLNNLFA